MKLSAAGEKKRIGSMLDALEKAYPDAAPQLNFSTPFELLIATMLSAQCTDKRVNITTAELFPLYNTPQAFAALSEEELMSRIRTCGLYKTKAKNIIAASKIIVTQYSGDVPHDRDTLITLPGVGRKTANVVISNAFGIPAIAVDTHVFRVANRMGLADAKDVINTEKQLMQNIPVDKWSIAHHWLIFHGRRVCSARNPKCDACAVREYCKHDLNRKK